MPEQKKAEKKKVFINIEIKRFSNVIKAIEAHRESIDIPEIRELLMYDINAHFMNGKGSQILQETSIVMRRKLVV